MCACLMNIFCACPRRNKSRPGRSELLAFGCLLILHLILLLKNMSSFLQVVNFLTVSCLPEFCCKRLLQKSENFWQVGLQTPKALPEFCTFYMFCGLLNKCPLLYRPTHFRTLRLVSQILGLFLRTSSVYRISFRVTDFFLLKLRHEIF